MDIGIARSNGTTISRLRIPSPSCGSPRAAQSGATRGEGCGYLLELALKPMQFASTGHVIPSDDDATSGSSVMRASRISGLASPTAVQIRGVIVSPNGVTSPVTLHPAAVLECYFFAVGERGDELVFAARLGTHVVVKTFGGCVLVPVQDVDVYYRGANPAGVLVHTIPSVFAALAADRGACELALRGALFYRELALVSGQPVRLRGTVTPLAAAATYRASPAADVIVSVEAERAVLSADVVEQA